MLTAYSRLAGRSRSKTVRIADLARESGLPLPALHSILRYEMSRHNAVLSDLDDAHATQEDRAAEISGIMGRSWQGAGDRPARQVRLLEARPLEVRSSKVADAERDARFRELTLSWTGGGTLLTANFVLPHDLAAQAKRVADPKFSFGDVAERVAQDWKAWKAAHPAEYRELEQMRAEVLTEQGFTVGPVWHGTDAEFTEFVTDREGAHFGTWKQADAIAPSAGTPASKVRAFLRMSNPLRVDDLGTWGIQAVIREVRRLGIPLDVDAAYDNLNRSDTAAWEYVKSAVERAGYDGFVYENELEGEGDSFVAFRSSQIKSADVAPDSAGRIPPPSQWGDAQNPDIRDAPSERGEERRMKALGLIAKTRRQIVALESSQCVSAAPSHGR